MCESSYSGIVEEIVTRKVNARIMFTAYDITCQARARGLQISHKAVRNIVHFMYRYGQMESSYSRTLMDLGGQSGPVYVFHRYEQDPCDFKARRVQRQMHSIRSILAQFHLTPFPGNDEEECHIARFQK